jgi:hypothetical protein
VRSKVGQKLPKDRDKTSPKRDKKSQRIGTQIPQIGTKIPKVRDKNSPKRDKKSQKLGTTIPKS